MRVLVDRQGVTKPGHHPVGNSNRCFAARVDHTWWTRWRLSITDTPEHVPSLNARAAPVWRGRSATANCQTVVEAMSKEEKELTSKHVFDTIALPAMMTL